MMVPGVLEDRVGLMVGHLISSSLEEDLREVGEDREAEEEAAVVTRLEVVEEETSGMHPISGMLLTKTSPHSSSSSSPNPTRWHGTNIISSYMLSNSQEVVISSPEYPVHRRPNPPVYRLRLALVTPQPWSPRVRPKEEPQVVRANPASLVVNPITPFNGRSTTVC